MEHTEANEKEELKRYADAVNNLALHKDGVEFDNKNLKHAAIVIASILNHSEKEVIIYEDNLSGNISDCEDVFSLKKSFEDFLLRNGKIKIVLTDTTERISELGKDLKFYSKFFSDDVVVKKVSDEFKKSIADEGGNVFFIIGDDSMIRKEDISHIDDRIGNAKVNFNDPETSKKLSELFMKNLDTCDNYF